MLFELGVPALLVTLCWVTPRCKRKGVVVLGALTPLLLAYAATACQYLASDRLPGLAFGFWAMWLMTFAPFVGCALLGIGLSFIPKPDSTVARYALGFAAPAFIGLAIFVGL